MSPFGSTRKPCNARVLTRRQFHSPVCPEGTLEAATCRDGRRPIAGAATAAAVVAADHDLPRRLLNDRRYVPAKGKNSPPSVAEGPVELAEASDRTDDPVVAMAASHDRAAALPGRDRVYPKAGTRRAR
jgi:hypothetical protein